MFYVIYNPNNDHGKRYLDTDGSFGPYDQAEQFRQPSPAILMN